MKASRIHSIANSTLPEGLTLYGRLEMFDPHYVFMNVVTGKDRNVLCRQGGSLRQELERTAEMLVDITGSLGVYYAVAFLYDSSYNLDRIRQLLPVLEKRRGAITKKD